jgi:hypothetical protein
LSRAKFDARPHLARLPGELGKVNLLAPIQKNPEVIHIKNTADLNTASYGACSDACGVMGAMIGQLGQGTPAAKKLQTIRSKMRNHTDNNSSEPTPPAPTSPAPKK